MFSLRRNFIVGRGSVVGVIVVFVVVSGGHGVGGHGGVIVVFWCMACLSAGGDLFRL
jgi:hypothetical protein